MSTWQVDVDTIMTGMQQYMGRPSLVVDGILRIMSENLERVLRHVNMPERTFPRGYHLAGEYLGDPDTDKWPKILVGASIQTPEMGSGHIDHSHVMITCAHGPQISRREFREALDVVTVARNILRTPMFSGHFYDPDDPSRLMWNHILPAGFQVVPEQWPLYSGWIASVTVTQTPGSSQWQTD